MEQLFDFAKEAMEEPVITLEKYKELQKTIAILSEYYSSKEWKQIMLMMKQVCFQRT